jgi:hypothetical protein
MSELLSFEDAARELGATTEEVSRLVRMGKLKTAERGGLLMVTRESIISQKTEAESVPLELAEEPKPGEGTATLRLAPETEVEEVGAEEEKKPAAAAAPQPPGEKTESIFGDVELETFAEVPAEGGAAAEEVGQLEEAGEELGAEEVAQLAQAGAPAARRALAGRPETSTAVTVLMVVTFILLLFAGLVIVNFGLRKSQVIFDPIQSWLGGAAK